MILQNVMESDLCIVEHLLPSQNIMNLVSKVFIVEFIFIVLKLHLCVCVCVCVCVCEQARGHWKPFDRDSKCSFLCKATAGRYIRDPTNTAIKVLAPG